MGDNWQKQFTFIGQKVEEGKPKKKKKGNKN